MKKLFFLAVALIGISAISKAQTEANAGVFARIEVPSTSGGGGANVPQSINRLQDLNFGIITNTLSAGTSGEITLAPSGDITIASGTSLTHATMKGDAAQFLIKGATPGQITISYPATLQLTGVDGPPVMLTLTPNAISTAACWEDVAGTTDKKFKIGGKLTIPANAWGGYSSGTGLTITVTHF